MVSKPKVLVTGASGLLGRQIVKRAKSSCDVTGIVNKRSQSYQDQPNFVKCDLLQSGVEDVLKAASPQVIVHSAAERFPDKVENDWERVEKLNVTLSAQLAKYSYDNDIRFIYISTDYVFDGTSPPYAHTDSPNPLNKYGKTKYEGEKAVLQFHPGAIVLRIPILYGPLEYIGESAVTSLLPSLVKRETVNISHYEKRYPSHTDDIAKIICDLIHETDEDGDPIQGIYQWSGMEQMTKYEMILSMAKVFDLPHDHVVPVSLPSSGGAMRPFDSRMSNSRLESIGISHHTAFEEGIEECLKQWVKTLVSVEK